MLRPFEQFFPGTEYYSASWKGMWAKLGSNLTGSETCAPVGPPSSSPTIPIPASHPSLPAAPTATEKRRDKRIREGKIGDVRAEQTQIGAGLLRVRTMGTGKGERCQYSPPPAHSPA